MSTEGRTQTGVWAEQDVHGYLVGSVVGIAGCGGSGVRGCTRKALQGRGDDKTAASNRIIVIDFFFCERNRGGRYAAGEKISI